MKRDMELVRQLLLAIEENPSPDGIDQLSIENYSEDEIIYHVMLLAQAQFIDAYDMSSVSKVYWWPKSLTWRGHEFLDDIRDDNVWNKTKQSVSEQVSSISLAVFQEVAKGTAKSLLGLP